MKSTFSQNNQVTGECNVECGHKKDNIAVRFDTSKSNQLIFIIQSNCYSQIIKQNNMALSNNTGG
jgi:hypothetical protein